MITGEIIGARGVQGLSGELPGHAHYGIQGPPGPQGEPGKDYVLTPEDRKEIAEMAAGLVEVPDSGGNVDQVSVEPAKMDRPKIFFGSPLQQTKDEIVTTFSYRSETLFFDCYAEIKAQGNSTLNWPKKNQTVKLYKDAACTEKFKVDFKGWGKQNKFVIKANWRDLTHVRDIVSVRLEGDCMRSNPDYEELPELLKTSPNLGGIDGFPVVVYAAGIYQGRYMWNIPKDKWMTNMDDELDEHCILCSEDYNSSCFRAAANINGNDWTDEIHDTVPASIKTRWNEVISFVRNSSDEEFVANLDSYIKVSTLIDRHIMGMYSCDFDGYGKNQLYLTYDGQQWFAGRYDKDGTWGNYWTGNNMLPSSYGREQYEDMISGRPGNLLFIRLEQLFWQRLQTRWAELKVGALSIANTINRFRELYDITPPYLIEEDYASTTANGAFTGIPNKTTCTIQQIQKFVVERHAWMDGYMASLTPEIPVPCEGITLDKNTLTFSGEGTQTVTATVIPDGCTDNVVWVCSDPSVAAISVNGYVCTVEASANGNATITATCGEYSAICSVAVSGIAQPVPCTGISLDKNTLTFTAEGEQTITATVTPIDTTDNVVWVSSAPTVANITVNGDVCTVQSVSNGDAVITVTCGEYSASCAVSVSGISNESPEEPIEPGSDIDYTLDALTGATWIANTTYDKTTGATKTGNNDYLTEKMPLQECSYILANGSGTSYLGVAVYDLNDNYIGQIELGKTASVKFYANANHRYAIHVYSTTGEYENATLLPVDNSKNAQYRSLNLAEQNWVINSNNKLELAFPNDLGITLASADQTNITILTSTTHTVGMSGGTSVKALSPEVFWLNTWNGTEYLISECFSTVEAAVAYFAENNAVLEINKRYQ